MLAQIVLAPKRDLIRSIPCQILDTLGDLAGHIGNWDSASGLYQTALLCSFASPGTGPKGRNSLMMTGSGGGGSTTLYRGIPPGTTEKAVLGRQGIARPRGSRLDETALRKHVSGEDMNAGVTSWTTSRSVAKRFSGPNGTIIEVQMGSVSDRIIRRPNIGKYADEAEVLLKEEIRGMPTKP